MSTSATKDCNAALSLIEAQMVADIQAMFAQLREHVGRQNPRLTFAAMVDRHPAIEKCIEAVAKQTGATVQALIELGTDVVDDCADDMATCIVSLRRRIYPGVFEEVVEDAKREAFEHIHGSPDAAYDRQREYA